MRLGASASVSALALTLLALSQGQSVMSAPIQRHEQNATDAALDATVASNITTTAEQPVAPILSRGGGDKINIDPLPLCYQQCMREKAGSLGAGFNVLELSPHDFCENPKAILVNMWYWWHYIPCLESKCSADDAKQTHQQAMNWYHDTCGKNFDQWFTVPLMD